MTVAARENGSVWRELSDTAQPGMNVLEYDLGVDARLADAAEAGARAKAREKEAREKALADKSAKSTKSPSPAPSPSPSPAATEDEEDAERPEKTASSSGKPMLDPELERLLADPMRATRKRYLPAGSYTVEVRAGGATATSTLKVKPPKDADADNEDDEPAAIE